MNHRLRPGHRGQAVRLRVVLATCPIWVSAAESPLPLAALGRLDFLGILPSEARLELPVPTRKAEPGSSPVWKQPWDMYPNKELLLLQLLQTGCAKRGLNQAPPPPRPYSSGLQTYWAPMIPTSWGTPHHRTIGGEHGQNPTLRSLRRSTNS